MTDRAPTNTFNLFDEADIDDKSLNLMNLVWGSWNKEQPSSVFSRSPFFFEMLEREMQKSVDRISIAHEAIDFDYSRLERIIGANIAKASYLDSIESRTQEGTIEDDIIKEGLFQERYLRERYRKGKTLYIDSIMPMLRTGDLKVVQIKSRKHQPKPSDLGFHYIPYDENNECDSLIQEQLISKHYSDTKPNGGFFSTKVCNLSLCIQFIMGSVEVKPKAYLYNKYPFKGSIAELYFGDGSGN